MAATKHTFDPLLSLTGDTSTSPADNVPDPGFAHPPARFDDPCGVATDRFGYIYVASSSLETTDETGVNGRIDIFNPAGEFVLQIPDVQGPCALAIDQIGTIYVARGAGSRPLVRYEPNSFPVTTTTTYVVSGLLANGIRGVAFDSTNELFYVTHGFDIQAFKPNGEPNGLNDVQEFTVDASSGIFNLAFFSELQTSAAGFGTLVSGSNVVTASEVARGKGTLTNGSTAVESVSTIAGTFVVGQVIKGTGIPSGTTITEATRTAKGEFVRLSQPATLSGTEIGLSTEAAPGIARAFGPEQLIFGPGIPAGSHIESANGGSLTLSAAATKNVSGAPLAAGRRGFTFRTGGKGSGSVSAGFSLISSVSSAEGQGTVTAGSTSVSLGSVESGEFRPGQTISGAGIQPGTTITLVEFASFQLSKPATTSGTVSFTAQDPFTVGQVVSGDGIPAGTTIVAVSPEALELSADVTKSGAVTLEAGLPFDSSPELVERSLEAVAAIGAGNVTVTGGPGGPGGGDSYGVSFKGGLANRDLAQLGVDGSRLEGPNAEVTSNTAVSGYDGTIGFGTAIAPNGIDVWDENGDVSVAASLAGELGEAKVLTFDGFDGHLKRVLSGTPEHPFGFKFGEAGVAIDQGEGDLYVSDVEPGFSNELDHFDSAGTLVEPPLKRSLTESFPYNDVAVDSSPESPNLGYVYVTSGKGISNSHLYAFAPVQAPDPPNACCLNATEVSDTEARITGQVNPQGAEAKYYFEYGDGSCELNPCIRLPFPAGNAGGGSIPVQVSEMLQGLQPDTMYHFRLVAVSECEVGEECVAESDESTFTTYSKASPVPSDGRVYELVSPGHTNGRIPTGDTFGFQASGFYSPLVTADGESTIFGLEGGTLPGIGGNGFYDTYRAIRTSAGWLTSATGPTGAQAERAYPGAVSRDHELAFWKVDGDGPGSLSPGKGAVAHYLRLADGSFEPIGIGSLGSDTKATGKLIARGGSHVIFMTGEDSKATAVQLEPAAPPSGTRAIYDRRPGGPTHVVSLLPGDTTPTEDAFYRGVSVDGTAVAFEVSGALYVRLDNNETILVSSDAEFAGFSSDGSEVFFAEDGDIFVRSLPGSATTQIGSGGESTIVNISLEGDYVYFVSPQLLGEGSGEAGKENLYVWSKGAIRYIATVNPVDVSGESENGLVGGLGQWISDVVAPSQDLLKGPANDPSRTTPGGSVLVFESRANLTDEDDAGHTQVYRFDVFDGSLKCVSCLPTGLATSSEARLLERRAENSLEVFPPVNAITEVSNVTSDGDAVFFQSSEPLVVNDVDGKLDVYEWKADGKGDCERLEGCISLVSSGNSSGHDFLYAMSPDGRDILFQTADSLVSEDVGGGPSIYDARMGGGFPGTPPGPPPCVGDVCQGNLAGVPALPGPGSATVHGAGNVMQPPPACPKGKKRVRQAGKTRCIRKRGKQKADKKRKRGGHSARGGRR